MTSLNIKLLLKNKVLWAWPVIAILLALFGGWYVGIQPAGNNHSFLFGFDGTPSLPSAFMIDGLTGFFVLIAVIGLPSHFSKNLESNRASLLLSKPVSRTDFFFSEFAAVTAVSFLYTLVTVLALAVLLAVKASIFPLELYLAMLMYIPLSILVVYISIAFLLILTHSYLASVLIGYLVISPISSFLLEAETFLGLLGMNTEAMRSAADVLSYLIPSSAGMEKIMAGMNMPSSQQAASGPPEISGVLMNGFAAFDWQLFAFVIISCLPFFLASYYLMRKKEF